MDLISMNFRVYFFSNEAKSFLGNSKRVGFDVWLAGKDLVVTNGKLKSIDLLSRQKILVCN